MTDEISILSGVHSPPWQEDSEYAAVGCALIDPTGAALRTMTTIIDVNDFHDGRARVVFGACLAVREVSGCVDVVLVHDYLIETDQLSAIGGSLMLDTYMNAVQFTAHAEHYARIVVKNSIRRQVYRAARDLAIAAHEAHESLDSLRERARRLAETLDSRMTVLRPMDHAREGLE